MTDEFVLVIDDEQSRLDSMAAELSNRLHSVNVVSWLPDPAEDHFAVLKDFLARQPTLLMVDQDLSISSSSLSGSTISSWSQRSFIPVCNYSRQHVPRIPREANFFELRVPSIGGDGDKAEYVAAVMDGFVGLRQAVSESVAEDRSAAGLLAEAMGQIGIEFELEPYIASVGATGSNLVDVLRQEGVKPTKGLVDKYYVYMLGHVLVNGVLRFPGPILPVETLAAYCAVGRNVHDDLLRIFSAARYEGPFASTGSYFWRSIVDRVIDDLAKTTRPQIVESSNAELDEYNRSIVLSVLGRPSVHDCERCGGTRGGFWCPFSMRPTCNQAGCSVVSAPWVPRGATMCRVEHEYYDIWSPLLGE